MGDYPMVTTQESKRIEDTAKSILGEDAFDQLSYAVKALTILEAINKTGSTDPDKVSGRIFRDSNAMLPLETIKGVYLAYQGKLEIDGFITSKGITEKGLSWLNEHISVLKSL